MEITAQLVKELRTRTGVGMMECKRALVACEGDLEAAVLHLRKTGQMQADRKSGRTAAEGSLALARTSDGSSALLLEVNSETDFVAKEADFLAFAQACADAALQENISDVETLMGHATDDGTFDDKRQALIGRLGENIQVRRMQRMDAEGGVLGCYLHGRRIGAVVALEGEMELARDLAMHVAASQPMCVGEADVPAEVLEKERSVLTAQAQDSNKPAEIIEKIVEGRLRKYLSEITLLGQSFVKDPDQTVDQLVKSNGATVKGFVRLEVGEGIEKKQSNFAEEVRAQAEGH